MVQAVGPLAVLNDGSFALHVQPETWTDTKALAASTAEAFAVPTGAKYVVFGSDVNFCARFNASAAGPAAAYGDIADGTGVIINPTIRWIKGVAEISVLTAVAGGGNVSVTYYK